jgi:hypothetical protein
VIQQWPRFKLLHHCAPTVTSVRIAATMCSNSGLGSHCSKQVWWKHRGVQAYCWGTGEAHEAKPLKRQVLGLGPSENAHWWNAWVEKPQRWQARS